MAKKKKKDIEIVDELTDLERKELESIRKKQEKEKKRLQKLEDEIRKTLDIGEFLIKTESGDLKISSELSLEEISKEIERCADDPIYFIETYLTIFDQTAGETGAIVPFKLFNFQKDLILTYKNNKRVITNKYRQAGISTTTCAFITWYLIFKSDRTVAIIADKLETARDQILTKVTDYLSRLPYFLRLETKGTDTKTHKKFDNGNQVKCFATKTFRGYTPTLLFWDETAHSENNEGFWEAAAPSLGTGGKVFFCSTPNSLDPVFYKTYMTATKGESEWCAVELHWFNDPRYNKELIWIRNKGEENEYSIKDENYSNEKRLNLYKDGWEPSSPWFEKAFVNDYNSDQRKVNQELLCKFLGSGSNFIPLNKVGNFKEKQVKEPIVKEWFDDNLWIWEYPIEGEKYLMGVDIASGKGEDYSCMNIYKMCQMETTEVLNKSDGTEKEIVKKYYKYEQVCEYHSKIEESDFAQIIYKYGRYYNNSLAIIDVSSFGGACINELNHLGYDKIYYSKTSNKQRQEDFKGHLKKKEVKNLEGNLENAVMVPGLVITESKRRGMLNSMRTAILNDQVILRSDRLVSEMDTFMYVKSSTRLADHERTAHDDCLMTLAFVVYIGNSEIGYEFDDSTAVKNTLSAMSKLYSKKERLISQHALSVKELQRYKDEELAKIKELENLKKDKDSTLKDELKSKIDVQISRQYEIVEKLEKRLKRKRMQNTRNLPLKDMWLLS